MAIHPGLEDLGALELFVSIVELGSLSRAAERHHVSQPAVSARLARLEARLGVSLLERSTRGCVPTSEGAAVVEWCRDLLGQAGSTGRAIEALTGESGAVTIAASLTIAEQLVPQWLAVLHAERPDRKVGVTVVNSARVVELVRDGEVRLGLVETTDAIYGLRARVLGEDRLALVVAPSHPWRNRRQPLTAEQLANTRLLVREHGSGTRVTLERALAKAGWSLVAPVLELASTAAIRNAVAAGVAPTVMSELAIADDLVAGRLVEIPTTGIDLVRPLTAIWKGTEPVVLEWLHRGAWSVGSAAR